MPEANLTTFSLEALSPSELEQKRRDIIHKYTSGTIENPLASLDQMSKEDLQQLAAITAALRGKTGGLPAKATKSPKAKTPKKTTVEDLEAML